MKRIFIAFPVPDSIISYILSYKKAIKKAFPGIPIKWTDRNNFHITFEFIGDTNDKGIKDICRILETITPNYPVIEYSLGGISGFPDLSRAKVLVVKVFDKDKTGFNLRQDIKRSLRKLGTSKAERSWKPHLTLGRTKKPVKMSLLRRIPQVVGSWKTDRVVLYESKLSDKGPSYHRLVEFKLGR